MVNLNKRDKENPHPNKKALLRGNGQDQEYLYTLVKSLNHLGYEFGCVSPIVSGDKEDYGYLVSLPDLFYLIDRISESLGMPKKQLEIPGQGSLFNEDSTPA
jgi:hypothetical protein